jgi:Ferritin-like domain
MRRRDILRAMAAAPVALGVQFLTPAPAFAAIQSVYAGPADVLNYLRTLQHVKTEFFRQGNAANLLSGTEADYLRQIGEDDQALLALFTERVGTVNGELAPLPAVAFGEAFRSRESYLGMAFDLANCCLQGYCGAAPALFQEQGQLQALLGGYGVQARHAALIGYVAGRPANGGVFKGPTEVALTRERVLSDLSPMFADASAATAGAARTE